MSQETDRELLELAAEAAGLTLEWVGGGPMVPYTPEESAARSGVDGYCWNPLTDDGDALRLAVRLNIRFAGEWGGAAVALFGVREFHEPSGNDPNAATRRAIVRAAAEIGRNTK